MKAKNNLVDNCASLWIGEHWAETSFGIEAGTRVKFDSNDLKMIFLTSKYKIKAQSETVVLILASSHRDGN